MKKKLLDIFQEVIELIPLIKETAFKDLERALKTYDYDKNQLELKISLFRQFFRIIQGKWSIDILFTLMFYEQYSFNEIKNALQGVSSRTLTDRLRLLEQESIIIREVKTTAPLRVNYSLSDFGKETVVLLIPIIVHLLKNSNIF